MRKNKNLKNLLNLNIFDYINKNETRGYYEIPISYSDLNIDIDYIYKYEKDKNYNIENKINSLYLFSQNNDLDIIFNYLYYNKKNKLKKLINIISNFDVIINFDLMYKNNLTKIQNYYNIFKTKIIYNWIYKKLNINTIISISYKYFDKKLLIGMKNTKCLAINILNIPINEIKEIKFIEFLKYLKLKLNKLNKIILITKLKEKDEILDYIKDKIKDIKFIILENDFSNDFNIFNDINHNYNLKYITFNKNINFKPDYISLYSNKNNYNKTDKTIVSFFEFDKKFDSINGLFNAINSNDKILLKKFEERFKNVKYFISPDYSQIGNSLKIENLYRYYKQRLVSTYLVKDLKKSVIPLITFGNSSYFKHMLKGIKDSNIVCFSVNTILKHNEEILLLKKAIKYTVDNLKNLEFIIVYSNSKYNEKIYNIFAYAIYNNIEIIIPDNNLKIRNSLERVNNNCNKNKQLTFDFLNNE